MSYHSNRPSCYLWGSWLPPGNQTWLEDTLFTSLVFLCFPIENPLLEDFPATFDTVAGIPTNSSSPTEHRTDPLHSADSQRHPAPDLMRNRSQNPWRSRLWPEGKCFFQRKPRLFGWFWGVSSIIIHHHPLTPGTVICRCQPKVPETTDDPSLGGVRERKTEDSRILN